ncbi:hypothetical protein FRB90_011667 [Tulasnella sp. 427]|nr:hypothetical protein FRB90_011667 [Tulasnella sp. 427]
MLDGRAPPPSGLPPPSATQSISPGPTPAPRRSAPLTKANPNKDVGGNGSFWAGAINGLGGVTSVHRMVAPELTPMASVLAGKAPRTWGMPLFTASLGTLPGHGARSPQDNINPNMNSRSPVSTGSSSPPSSQSEMESTSSEGESSSSPNSTPPQSPPLNLISNLQATQLQQQQPWSGFGDINPFTIKTLDAYRMQLWSKMAAAGHVPAQPPTQQQQQQQQQQQALFNTYSNGSNLTGHLRPAFFDTPEAGASAGAKKANASSLSALLAGKTASNLAASSSSSTPSSVPSTSPNPKADAQYAAAAASLVSRMSSAFRDAFTQPSASPASSSPAAKAWDMDKVRKVLEGKAVLKVVDVDQLSPVGLKKSPLLRARSVDPSLEEKMSRLSLNMSTGLSREDREVDSTLSPLVHGPSAMKPSAFKTLLK